MMLKTAKSACPPDGAVSGFPSSEIDDSILPLKGPALEATFAKLVKEWKEQRQSTTTARRMAEHPAYRKIIALGMPVVPLIIKEMAREHDHWFMALQAITKASPVPVESRGKIDEMTAAWIHWWQSESNA